MLRGCRYIVLALGLTLCVSAAYSQDQQDPSLEREPVAEPGQEEGATTSEQNAAAEQQPAIDYSPVFERVESAIRDLKTEIDEAERHRQEQREIDDLDAQQEMALWAKGVFGASIGTIFVTLTGLFLIWRTLLHTRRAADYAGDMVDEAKLATAAANENVQVGQRQMRAYVVADRDIEWQSAYKGTIDNIVGHNFTIKWKNCGLTPARRCHGRTSLKVFDGVMPKDFDYPDKAAPDITETNHVGPNQTIRSKVGGLSISDGNAVERGEKHVYVWGWLEYDDIFGNTRRRTEVCYHLLLSRNQDGQTCTPAISGPFNGADEDCHHQPKT